VYLPEYERLLGAGAKATARLQARARQRGSAIGIAYGLSLAACMAIMLIEKGHMQG
jgi:hypothetical protein